MAETPLPSRETIGEAVTFAHITDSDGDHLCDIAQAYVEGRLVDREATFASRCVEVVVVELQALRD